MFEVNTTYSSSNAFSANATTASQNGQPAYRIGQNRIISSSLQQPQMAEISNLHSLPVGATNPWDNEQTNTHTVRRVNGGGHMADPYLTPVGDTPLLLLAILIIGYIGYKYRRNRSTH